MPWLFVEMLMSRKRYFLLACSCSVFGGVGDLPHSSPTLETRKMCLDCSRLAEVLAMFEDWEVAPFKWKTSPRAAVKRLGKAECWQILFVGCIVAGGFALVTVFWFLRAHYFNATNAGRAIPSRTDISGYSGGAYEYQQAWH